MQVERSILNQAEWDTLYPKANLAKPDSQRIFLHYLLAMNQPDSAVLGYIEKNKKSVTLIAIDEGRHGLTPLIIAVMKARRAVVGALLACWQEPKVKKAQLEQRDQHHWTALLHAAISSSELFELLRSHGASDDTVIPLECVKELTQENVSSLSFDRCFVETDSGLLPLRQFGIQKIGLKRYRDVCYFDNTTLKALWERTEGPFQSITSKRYCLKLYHQFFSNPPELVIGLCKELLGKAKHPFELRTKEALKEGICFSIYTGESVRSIESMRPSFEQLESYVDKLAYVYGDIDAKESGNASRMANWGWPNCASRGVVHNGQRHSIFYTLDPVAANEALVYDYSLGMLPLVLLAPCPILRHEKMLEYFKKGFDVLFDEYCDLHVKHLIPALQSNRTLSDSMVLRWGKVDTLFFPLSFPTAMIDLHYRGVVPIEKWSSLLFNNCPFPVPWGVGMDDLAWIVRTIFYQISSWEKSMSNPALREVIRDWVLANIGSLSLLQLLKGMQELYLGQGQVSLEKLQQSLSTYDPAKDTSCPIGQEAVMACKLKCMAP